MTEETRSIRGVCEIFRPSGGSPDLVIEVPHGATDTADFSDLASRMTSSLPEGLIDFFYANTDVGAPELAMAVARLLAPYRSVAVIRCRIPRTLIDCNRVVDATERDGMTPGLMPWIETSRDRELLLSLYGQYLTDVAELRESLAPGGALLQLHTYAPRSIDVEVDGNIVASLRWAYEPERRATWPLRPALDAITRLPTGEDTGPSEVLDALRLRLRALHLEVADSATYALHPSTLAHQHAQRLPGRSLCLEVRRDLVVSEFDPFAPMRVEAAKVDLLAAPIAEALTQWWPNSVANRSSPVGSYGRRGL